MSTSDFVALSRRQFMASWAAVAAGVSIGSGGRMSVVADETSEVLTDPVPPNLELAHLPGAEAVLGLKLSDPEREQVLPGLVRQRKQFQERRQRGSLANSAAPALRFDPRLPGQAIASQPNEVRPSAQLERDLPASEEAIAFAPVTQLAAWIRSRQISSERLTRIYLRRLEQWDPFLHCVVTRTDELALALAQRADREIAAGQYRGPLHGIPWGAKDLLDTAGIATTWGAMPYRDRVAESNAVVIDRLENAGAVLVAKLTLGALAMGDVWFDEVTRNPFNPEQGSSGSSAGSASATAAGLVGFSLGTETLGSIVSPSMRCGTTGLRPTFGRVPRTGAMALCWSLDKIGPICRSVEDTALVLAAINGADSGDTSSIEHGFHYDGQQALSGLRVGYSPEWFAGEDRDRERRVLQQVEALGVRLVEVSIPDLPYSELYTILNVEAAAAFEELTLSGRDDRLVRQTAGAWPNLFRRAWFVPAVELLQADRLRREVMEAIAHVFESVDVLFSPSFGNPLLIATNFTGHPSLTLRTGFRDNGTPVGMTFWGQLFQEGALCRVGRALEQSLDVWDRRPEFPG